MTTPIFNTGALERLGDSSLSALRETFGRVGFDESFIGRAEKIAPRQLDRVRLPAVLWWLRRQEEGAALLARLFSYADAVSKSDVEKTIPQELIQELLDVGFLERREDDLLAQARIMPFEGLYLASDEMDAPGDPVMGPGATTLQLSRAMKVEPGSSVLDVGCGAGTLALVAASRGAKRAVGVDLLDRAVDWSTFNARLNGLQATFASGDLTAPVLGDTFDLVVSQPPFVVQTEELEATTYLQGGASGDEIALRLIGELPTVLVPGGSALVLFDTPVPPGPSIEERIVPATKDDELQIYAVVASGHPPEMQAIAYSSIRHPNLDSAYAASVHIYCEHLASLGIETSSHVLLQARPTPQGEQGRIVMIGTDDVSRWNAEAFDDLHVGVSLALKDEKDILGISVCVSPHARLVQETAFGPEPLQRHRIIFEGGRVPALELSDAAAVLVDAARSSRCVKDIVSTFAKAAGARPGEVQPQVLEFIKQGLASGLFITQ